MARIENYALVLFALLFIFSISMLFLGPSQVTGYATSSTTSNVTISGYVSISMSTNLSLGILYGSITALPATNVNSTHNYDGSGSASSMYMNVSTNSNSAVDFCVNANSNMIDSGGDVLNVGNETYANSTASTDTTSPAITNNVTLTTSYVKAGANIGRGNSTFYRFWLGVPAGQAVGTYNNTISFEGVTTGSAC